MASKAKKKQSKKKQKDDKKKLDISAVAIIDNMVFSKKDCWAFYKLTSNVFDFLSTEQKISLGYRLTSAYAGLMSNRQEPLECAIIVSTIPVDVEAWEAQVRTVSSDWKPTSSFEGFISDQIKYLRQEEYSRRVAYIGINLGRRGALDIKGMNVLDAGFAGATDTMKKWLSSALMIPDEEVSENEEKTFRRSEEDTYRTISTGNLQGERVSAEDLLLLIKRQMYPAMPTPYLDVDHGTRIGRGDIELELGSVIENHYRFVKMTQMYRNIELEGYRATLTFSRFPEQMAYPNNPFPFLYFPAYLSAPFTVYSRFTLHPSEKIKSQLEKKRKEQKDEIINASTAQKEEDAIVDGAPAETIQALHDSQLIAELIATDKTPWVEGTYRIVIEADTEENLKTMCSEMKSHFNERLGINVQWTTGDQVQLFLESMPGDTLRGKSFKHTTNISMLAASGSTLGNEIGDPIFNES